MIIYSILYVFCVIIKKKRFEDKILEKEYEKFHSSNIFEGMTSIRSVIKALEQGVSDRRIIEILYSKEREKSRSKEINYLSKIAPKYGFTLSEVSEDDLNAIAIGNTHGGILAKCTDRTIPSLTSLSGVELPSKGFYVMLDGIEDPYNFGYSLRSIYAAGANGIILPMRNWLTAAGVVARASAGASELLDLYTAEPAQAVEYFKANNYRIICADKQNSVSLYDADLSKPIFLIVGGEKRGIRASVLQKADEIVRIEYGREFNASLSAASAATILSYEIYRQNR